MWVQRNILLGDPSWWSIWYRRERKGWIVGWFGRCRLPLVIQKYGSPMQVLIVGQTNFRSSQFISGLRFKLYHFISDHKGWALKCTGWVYSCNAFLHQSSVDVPQNKRTNKKGAESCWQSDFRQTLLSVAWLNPVPTSLSLSLALILLSEYMGLWTVRWHSWWLGYLWCLLWWFYFMAWSGPQRQIMIKGKGSKTSLHHVQFSL